MSREKSEFEIAHQSLRQLIRYLRERMRFGDDAIKALVDGIIHSLKVEDLEKESPRGPA